MPSSVIHSFQYDPSTMILTIIYVSGVVYHYLDVPAVVYKELSKAKSKGTFLHKQIKGKFEYEKIYEP